MRTLGRYGVLITLLLEGRYRPALFLKIHYILPFRRRSNLFSMTQRGRPTFPNGRSGREYPPDTVGESFIGSVVLVAPLGECQLAYR